MENYSWILPEKTVDFQCIGSACSHSCCNGSWTIYVDQDSYEKLGSIHESSPLKPLLTHAIQQNPSWGGDHSKYARIICDGDCPFLNADRLCSIQLALGEDYLCQTCRAYPRIHYMIEEQAHIGFCLSCEEVVRRVLFDREGIGFTEVEAPWEYPFDLGRINLGSKAYASRNKRYFFEIRAFVIETLRNRRFRVWERLVLLGMFFRRLDEAGADAPAAIEHYRRIFAAANSDVLSGLLPRADIVLGLETLLNAFQFTDARLIKRVKKINEVLDTYARRNGRKDGWYRELMEEVYHPFIADNEHLLENLLIMEVFNVPDLFLQQTTGFLDGFGQLSLFFALFRLFLMCEAAQGEMSHKKVMDACTDMTHGLDLMQSTALKQALSIIKKSGNHTYTWYTMLLCE